LSFAVLSPHQLQVCLLASRRFRRLRRPNARTFFICSFTFVTLVTFLNFVQPYILEEILQIPVEQLGKVTGYLNVLHEGTDLIIVILAAGVIVSGRSKPGA